MKKRTLIGTAALFALLMIAALLYIYVEWRPFGPRDTGTIIALQRSVCFGNCPVYHLTIYGDGTVEYEGEENVAVRGKQTGKISQSQLRSLISAFEEVNYFKLADNYTYYTNNTMPHAVTSIRLNGKTKTVSHYHGDYRAPRQLTWLEYRIDEVVGSERWVGYKTYDPAKRGYIEAQVESEELPDVLP